MMLKQEEATTFTDANPAILEKNSLIQELALPDAYLRKSVAPSVGYA